VLGRRLRPGSGVVCRRSIYNEKLLLPKTAPGFSHVGELALRMPEKKPAWLAPGGLEGQTVDRQTIMPAPTVLLVDSSMRMKAPVAREST